MKYSDGDLAVTLSAESEITFTNTVSELNKVHVGKLFDRFFTVDNARRSTGLGFSIAKALVLQMNGTIDAKYKDKRLSIVVRFPDFHMKSI